MSATSSDEQLLGSIVDLLEACSQTPRRCIDVSSELLGLFAELPDVAEEIFGWIALNGDPDTRKGALEYAIRHPDRPSSADFIAWLTHDPEDHIAFRAIRACGELRLASAARDLFIIIGPLSERLTEGKGKPVGVGHALVMNALVRIIGSDDMDAVRDFEAEYFEEAAASEAADDDLVLIPPGDYEVGLSAERFPWRLFDVADTQPPHRMRTDGYKMDRTPVTVTQYDEFVKRVDETEHTYCHPAEPANKDHRRNTIGDRRFGPDHPVAGVDWFDAQAYARYHGKRLPTEEEWEVAARGPEGNIFPWGDDFDGTRCRWAGSVFGEDPRSLAHWRELLLQVGSVDPRQLASPPTGMQDNAFGIWDMVGNVWEWTETSFVTRSRLDPDEPSVSRASVEMARDPHALAVIKGGCWSSYADLLVPSYRGKDLIVDRHNEIGIRCVRDLA